MYAKRSKLSYSHKTIGARRIFAARLMDAYVLTSACD